MKRIWFLFLVFIFNGFLFGQEIAIGQWRVHLPYNRAITIADDDEKIYTATLSGIFSYNKTDGSFERLSKITGLSDNEVNSLAYNRDFKMLFIAYKNGNIDVIKDNRIINLSDIKRKQITADKIINNIFFSSSKAYLACGFGIVVIDLQKLEVTDTYFIDNNGGMVNVNEVTILNNEIFAATDKGVFKASMTAANLADYNSWTQQNLLPKARFNSIVSFNNTVVTNFNPVNSWDQDTIYEYVNGNWQHFNELHFSAYRLQVFGSVLYRMNYYNFNGYDTQKNQILMIYDYGFEPSGDVKPRQISINSDSIIYIADNVKGLVKKSGGTFTEIHPNGPRSTSSAMIVNNSNYMYVAAGSVDPAWGNTFSRDGIFRFDGIDWKYYNGESYPQMNDAFDFISVHTDNTIENKWYAGSWFDGLMEFDGETLTKKHNDTNSTLNRNWRCAIGGIAQDPDGNIWVTNSGSAKQLHIKKPDGTWKAFALNGLTVNTFVGRLILDADNKKWIQLPRGLGIYVYDDKGTIDDISDDEGKFLNQEIGNGGLHTTDIYSLVLDKNGEIWVGTDKGITVFHNPSGVFQSGVNFDAQQIKIEQDGKVSYLLESESITCIVVDGANRKWIGTSSAGVFLVSADGTEQLQNFNTDNSPLLSNNILCIGINQVSGEVFFGTESGIISYKSDATEPAVEYSGVYAYPNPVKPDYSGVIAIKGLVENATVKITDTEGNLVSESISLGGQAIWNGKNQVGEKVSTGVYLAFISNKDGSKTYVTKILFLN